MLLSAPFILQKLSSELKKKKNCSCCVIKRETTVYPYYMAWPWLAAGVSGTRVRLFADDVTARSRSFFPQWVSASSLLRWGEHFRYFLIFIHPSHTHFTVWLGDRLISVLFSSITAILVGLFWRLPPDIGYTFSSAATSLRRICGVHSDLSECVFVW